MVEMQYRSVCDGSCLKYGSLEVYHASSLLLGFSETIRDFTCPPVNEFGRKELSRRVVAQGA